MLTFSKNRLYLPGGNDHEKVNDESETPLTCTGRQNRKKQHIVNFFCFVNLSK